MAWQLQRLMDSEGKCAADAGRVGDAIERLVRVERPRFRRLWAYYRNTMHVVGTEVGGTSDRPYRQAQEWGLPARITGLHGVGSGDVFGGEIDGTLSRKEVVIENDIGWRVETIVDYLFGKPVVIRSAAPDPKRREVIDLLVRSIIAQNGGLVFLQQLALLGAVYGFVDVLVKLEPGCVETWRKEGVAPEDLVGMCGGNRKLMMEYLKLRRLARM